MATAAERWKQAREAAGLSVLDAARLADVHRNTIYDLEKGDEGVTLRMMNRVAPVYGVTLSHIFCDEPTGTRVPSELRPLSDLLQPLDQETRIKFIRNVVANARFMAQLIAVGDQAHGENGQSGYTSVPTPANEVAARALLQASDPANGESFAKPRPEAERRRTNRQTR